MGHILLSVILVQFQTIARDHNLSDLAQNHSPLFLSNPPSTLEVEDSLQGNDLPTEEDRKELGT